MLACFVVAGRARGREASYGGLRFAAAPIRAGAVCGESDAVVVERLGRRTTAPVHNNFPAEAAIAAIEPVADLIARSVGPGRYRPTRAVGDDAALAKRSHRAMELSLLQPAGTGRTLRSSPALGLRVGRMLQLREWLDRRRTNLRARAVGPARRRQRADLLLDAENPRQAGPLVGTAAKSLQMAASPGGGMPKLRIVRTCRGGSAASSVSSGTKSIRDTFV